MDEQMQREFVQPAPEIHLILTESMLDPLVNPLVNTSSLVVNCQVSRACSSDKVRLGIAQQRRSLTRGSKRGSQKCIPTMVEFIQNLLYQPIIHRAYNTDRKRRQLRKSSSIFTLEHPRKIEQMETRVHQRVVIIEVPTQRTLRTVG